jgi:hypothetical protein
MDDFSHNLLPTILFRVSEHSECVRPKLYDTFPVAAPVALHFGQRGKLLAFGLSDVLSRDLWPSLGTLDVIRE